MSEAQLYQRARRYCHERIAAAQAPGLAWPDALAARYLAELLYEIEQLTPADFASPTEERDLLGLAAEGALAHVRCTIGQEMRRFLRPQRLARADLAGALVAAHQAFCASLAAPLRRPAPPLPARRALPRHEAQLLWRRLEQARAALPRATHWDVDADVMAAIIAFMAAARPAQLVVLYPTTSQGYLLDPDWAESMLCFDDSYWAGEDFSWYLYAEGNGYPVVGGDLMAHLGAL